MNTQSSDTLSKEKIIYLLASRLRCSVDDLSFIFEAEDGQVEPQANQHLEEISIPSMREMAQ